MKKFTVPCDFGGKMAPFTIYIGEPESTHHPLHFQADWLSKERGGTIPGDVMESLAKLFQLAKKNNLSFEELCVYTLNQTNSGQVQPKLEEASVEPVLETPNTPGIKDENAEDEKIEAVTASNNSFWPESKTHDENHAEETLSDEEFLSKVQDEAIFNEEDFFASLFADINNWEDEVEEEKTPLADNVADQNTDNLAAPETELSALEENYLQDTTATAPNLQELHDEILEEIPADNYDNFLVQPDEIKKAEFIEENDEEFEEETEEENDDFETFLSTTNDDEENEDKIFGLGELTSEPEQPVIQSDVFYAEKSAEEDSHKLKNLSENFSKPEIKTEPEEENYFPQNQLEILQEELLQSNDIAEAEIIATNQTEVAQQKSDSEPTSAAATQNYTAEEYAAWQNYYQQYYQQYYQYYYQQQAQQQYQQQLMQYYQQMQAQQQYQQQQYYAQMQQQVTAQAQSLIQNNSAEIANHQLENIQSATMQAPASPAAVAPAVVAPAAAAPAVAAPAAAAPAVASPADAYPAAVAAVAPAAAAPAVAAPIAAPAPKPAPNLPETTEF
jgi:hypothetical protein